MLIKSIVDTLETEDFSGIPFLFPEGRWSMNTLACCTKLVLRPRWLDQYTSLTFENGNIFDTPIFEVFFQDYLKCAGYMLSKKEMRRKQDIGRQYGSFDPAENKRSFYSHEKTSTEEDMRAIEIMALNPAIMVAAAGQDYLCYLMVKDILTEAQRRWDSQLLSARYEDRAYSDFLKALCVLSDTLTPGNLIETHNDASIQFFRGPLIHICLLHGASHENRGTALGEFSPEDFAALRIFPAQWDPKLGIHVT